MSEYTKKIKKKIINRYLNGESISSISKSTGIARSTIYEWINNANKSTKITKDLNLRDIHDLKIKCDRQNKIIDIIRLSGCTEKSSQMEKYHAIDKLSTKYNVHTICEALQLSKGSYYNYLLRNKKENTVYAKNYELFTNLIEQIYNESGHIYGAGKITAILKSKGYKVSEETVSKIVHENGWFSMRSCAKTLYNRDQQRKRKENLLNRFFIANRPNEIWVSDVTYFPVNDKNQYICIIIDIFSRKVIAYKISRKNSTQLTRATFDIAYTTRNPTLPLIFHSDRGCNYTSKRFMKHLQDLGVQQSFSQKGNPKDNAVAESFFSNMKKEELYRVKYKSEREFKKSVSKYIEFYNEERPHTTISYKSPSLFEKLNIQV